MTTFKELVDRHPFDAVAKRMAELYPDQDVSSYSAPYERLRWLAPTPADWEIEVAYVPKGYIGLDNDPAEESWCRVGGVNPKTDEHYAIEFSPWSRWLGAHVSAWCLEELQEVDVIVHCLWEMTYVGFEEEEIQGALGETIALRDEYMMDAAKEKAASAHREAEAKEAQRKQWEQFEKDIDDGYQPIA